MPRPLLLLAVLLVPEISTSCRPTASDQQPAPDSPVAQLFEDLRLRSADTTRFPALERADISSLLALADDTERLTYFPINMLSSMSQAECSAGMLALWFIEGIRLGRPAGFPSLNPVCLGDISEDSDWVEHSESNLPRVAAAYRAWWKEVSAREDAFAIDPLEGSDLNWY